MKTTDATRNLYVYVRDMPNNVEHKLHTYPSTDCRLHGKDAVVAQIFFFRM